MKALLRRGAFLFGATAAALALSLFQPLAGGTDASTACAAGVSCDEGACIYGPNTGKWYCEWWEDASSCSSDSGCRDGRRLY